MCSELVTNEIRAAWGLTGVDAFAEVTGVEDESLTIQVGDLLNALMHLCNEEQVDFSTVLQTARLDFEQELAEEALQVS